MTKLLHADLTRQIIGVYYTVYNNLSQTYPEFIYERAMMALLERSGLPCLRQEEYEIIYKEKKVGHQRLDIFIAGEVVVELKVADSITPLHLAQLLSYLKVVSRDVGLLFRFGGPDPDFVRRVLTSPSRSEPVEPDLVALTGQEEWLYPEVTHQIIGGALEVYKTLGPGFIHRIYTHACYHELKLRGLEVKPHREFHVFLDDLDLGGIKFSHMQVDNRVLFFPVALSDLKRLNLTNLQAWMRYLNIPLAIIINFNTTRFKPLTLRME
jgi:GxxExxY protein